MYVGKIPKIDSKYFSMIWTFKEDTVVKHIKNTSLHTYVCKTTVMTFNGQNNFDNIKITLSMTGMTFVLIK